MAQECARLDWARTPGKERHGRFHSNPPTPTTGKPPSCGSRETAEARPAFHWWGGGSPFSAFCSGLAVSRHPHPPFLPIPGVEWGPCAKQSREEAACKGCGNTHPAPLGPWPRSPARRGRGDGAGGKGAGERYPTLRELPPRQQTPGGQGWAPEAPGRPAENRRRLDCEATGERPRPLPPQPRRATGFEHAHCTTHAPWGLAHVAAGAFGPDPAVGVPVLLPATVVAKPPPFTSLAAAKTEGWLYPLLGTNTVHWRWWGWGHAKTWVRGSANGLKGHSALSSNK